MKIGGRTCLVCDCEGTMPLQPDALAAALGSAVAPRLHHQLCRAELGRLEAALEEGGPLLVACQQAAPLFRDLADQHEGADLRLVDIRDAGGWSADAGNATPKLAALIEAATLEERPAQAVAMVSSGTCIVHGLGQQAVDVAARLAGRLDVTLVLAGDAGDVILPHARGFEIIAGRIEKLQGHLGAFKATLGAAGIARPSGGPAALFDPIKGGLELEAGLVLDLAGAMPLVPAPAKRDGYVHVDPGDPLAVERALFDIVDLVGEFDKPRYVRFDADLCAHSRSRKTGCTRCLDVCPTGAIRPAGDHVAIDPHICAGCGGCASVCPTGAATYDAPAPAELLARLQTLLRRFHAAGGTAPLVLVHDRGHGDGLIAMLARFGDGLPADVLPFALAEPGQLGLDALLAALAHGARGVLVLVGRSRRDDIAGIEGALAMADSIAAGLGYGGGRFGLVVEDDPDGLAAALASPMPRDAPEPGNYLLMGGKRERIRLGLDHLHRHAPTPVPVLPLAAGAPFGSVTVDVEGCTLCLACVSQCPNGALIDNPDKPMLRFIEDACIQCGLCVNTCPEKVIALDPRVNFTAEAKSPRLIKEEEPATCLRCGKAFGTQSSIERIISQLGEKHWMFKEPEQIARLRMCEDCRVAVQFEAKDNPFAAAPRPRPRTTEDYLAERAAARKDEPEDQG